MVHTLGKTMIRVVNLSTKEEKYYDLPPEKEKS